MRRSIGIRVSVLAALVFVWSGMAVAQQKVTVLRAARMLDVTSGEIIKNPVVVIDGARIWVVNPLKDVTVLEDVQFVMKGGKIFKKP